MHPHARRLAAIAIASAVGLLATGCGDTEEASNPAPVAEGEPTAASVAVASPVARAAGPGTGDLFVHGTITRDKAPAAGIRVSVNIPIADDSHVAVGETVPTWQSPPVATDADGHYAINVDDNALPAGYLTDNPEGDYANYDLLVFDDNQMARWSSTLAVVGDTHVWRTMYGKPAGSVQDMSIDLGTKTITVTDSDGEVETAALPIGELAAE
ncbi:hypothetical protein GCM10009798_24180 [Nocardioides panacihumi]|uniref:Carboxypeptidase regulatory-like domain-containing protein n=1 Tax=Nocardioides panacihumi TaxID=400774 RepID=A0ABN2R474_9ACTN